MQEHHGDFDPLEFDRFTRFQELTRSLAEGVNDVSTVQQSLLKNLDDADAALLAQARLSREVQQQLFAIRTVPFGSLSERLYRIMRVDREGARQARQPRDRRRADRARPLGAGKARRSARAPAAQRARSRHRAARSAPRRRQAGAGRDHADGAPGRQRNRDRARRRRRRHRPRRASAKRRRRRRCSPRRAQATDAQLARVHLPARVLDRVEGHADLRARHRHGRRARGDHRARRPRRGRDATPARGTRFTLSLPLTLAVAQAVLVRAGGRLWALPAPMVEQVQQVKSQALLDLYVQREVEWQGKRYPFHYLPRLLGETAHNPETQALQRRAAAAHRPESRRRSTSTR